MRGVSRSHVPKQSSSGAWVLPAAEVVQVTYLLGLAAEADAELGAVDGDAEAASRKYLLTYLLTYLHITYLPTASRDVDELRLLPTRRRVCTHLSMIGDEENRRPLSRK